MNAEKAIELLTPLKEEEFMQYDFTNGKDKCCVIGHLVRLTSENPSDYGKRNCTPDYVIKHQDILELNRAVDYKHTRTQSLLCINNKSDEGRIKQSLLTALNQLKTKQADVQ